MTPTRTSLQPIVLAALLAAAGAAEHCYDFDGLPVGRTYGIGDTVDARHALITFRNYKMNGNPVGTQVSTAETQQAKIAGGTPPEMGLKTITVQVTPKEPVTRVRVRLAQNMTPTGGFATANFEVNGEQHESPSGFAAADGKRLGGAQFAARFSNDAGNWHVGEFEIRARSGGQIKSFSIGGHTWRLDDMCLSR
jgi:hypothetical protein